MVTKTKNELITAIKAKAKKASPIVRRVFLRGLEYKKKSTLQNMLKKMRVTAKGDISIS